MATKQHEMPATFKSNDPTYVDEEGIYIGDQGLVWARAVDTVHLRKDTGYAGDAVAVCGGRVREGFDIVSYVSRDYVRTIRVCKACRGTQAATE
jgi:hypothetical protein